MVDEPGHAYERPDVASRKIVVVSCLFAAFVALTGAGLTFYYRVRTLGTPPPVPVTYPEPRLQVDTHADLAALQTRDRERLTTYGWVDRERGIVRVPIDAAMARVVARGAAGFDPAEGVAQVPSPARSAPDRSTTAPGR